VAGRRAGDLTPTWRFLLGAAWFLAFFAYAAIWNASVQIGIGTWWVGPRAQPTTTLVRLVPFVLCLGVALCVLYNTRRLILTSALAAGLTAIGAIPDFSRSPGLGIAEMAVAVFLAIVTAASLTGRYRRAESVTMKPVTSPPLPPPLH